MRKKGLLFLIYLIVFGTYAQKELDTLNTFDMDKMSRNINSSYHEGGPIVSPNGKELYFFRTNHPRNRFGDKGTQDIWFSKMDSKGNWSEAQNAGNTLNRYQSNQVFAVAEDGNALIISGGNSKHGVGVSICRKVGENWSKPIEFHIPDFEKMNKGKYYGATVSNDLGVIIFYFSETHESIASDLYVSTKVDTYKYTKPEKLHLSTSEDDLSPFLCKDNTTLYFSSGKKGGMGQVDIYEVKRLDETWKKWSEPKNMGEPLNSTGFDAYFTTEASFKNAYTTRAYMSSDGGSLDIWHFEKRPEIRLEGYIYDKKTKKPIETSFLLSLGTIGTLDESSDSIGYYNSKIMDRGLLVYTIEVDGYEKIHDTLDLRKVDEKAYFKKDFYLVPHPKKVFLSGVIYNSKTKETIGNAQVRMDSKRFHDIIKYSGDFDGYYAAELPDIGKYKIHLSKDGFYPVTEYFEAFDGEEPLEYKKDIYLSPKEKPIVLSGEILNAKNFEAISGKILYFSPDGEKGEIVTDKNGKFKQELPEPGIYKLYTAVENFMANNDTVNVFIPSNDKEFQKQILLTPIEVGASVRLNDIYFDFNKSNLRPESFPEIDRAIDFMKFNKSIVVEISGHTDNRGSDAYNLELSQHRAESVVKYMIDNGIQTSRLLAKGYGESKPSVENDTEINRQFNRRVEFTILKL